MKTMPTPEDENIALQSFVEKGCDFFGFEFGIISRINLQEYHILGAIAKIPFYKVGDCFELKNTLCSDVIRTGSTVCYNQVADIEHVKRHPAYRDLNLESYIGAPIRIDGHIVGTVNFASIVARELKFPHSEIDYLEAMADELANSHPNVF